MQPHRPLEVFTFLAVLASLPLGLAAQSPVSVSAQLDFKTKYLFAGIPFAADEVTQAPSPATFGPRLGLGGDASLWMRLRYKSARLLFTGDSHQPYERNLIKHFSAGHLRADVLKVTHLGSSSGTSTESVAAAKPAFAITSSSQDDPGHRLENDTKARILDTPVGKRRIFNTDADGDIVVKTDGEDYGGAILYQVT